LGEPLSLSVTHTHSLSHTLSLSRSSSLPLSLSHTHTVPPQGGARMYAQRFFFFFTLHVYDTRRSLSLELSDTRVYEPQRLRGGPGRDRESERVCERESERERERERGDMEHASRPLELVKNTTGGETDVRCHGLRVADHETAGGGPGGGERQAAHLEAPAPYRALPCRPTPTLILPQSG